MVLELHTWGPGFNLPSFDAQCLAAIFYLRKCLNHHDWVLIPSSDPAIGPLGELPALRDGDTWVAGFSDIVNYLRDVSNDRWSLDTDLTDAQRGDCLAFSAFVDSRGQPLLDLCLYVSSDNYLNCTRQVLGDVLAWPESWTSPHQLRTQAKKRSEHLGLSSLDVDTAQEDGKEDTGLTAHIPKSLRRPKQTVSGLLGRNAQKNRFRLDAVTDDFLETLADMLGDKTWLLGSEESSADCLAIGYLSLMQTSRLQHGWVKEALRTKYPKLDRWVRTQADHAFGPPVDVALVMGHKAGLSPTGLELPWAVPPARTFKRVFHSVLEGCIGSMPAIKSMYTISEIGSVRNAGGPGRYREKQTQLARIRYRREVFLEVLTSTLSVAGLITWLIHTGGLPLPRWAPIPTQRRYGEAGAFLGIR